MAMTMITKAGLSVRNDFDMNSAPSCKFLHSQWEECKDEAHASLPYLAYRILFMVILVSSITFSTLCESYLFEIFLTNWSFTLQTLYAILFAFNVLWRMRRTLMQKMCPNSYHNQPESNAKAYELNVTNSTWDNFVADDRNSMILNEDTKNSLILDEDRKNSATLVNSGNNVVENLHQPNSATSVLTTDASPRRKSETTVIISNNNNNKNNNSVNEDPPNKLEKVIWVLMNVSHVLPHIVTFGYWIFVYKYDPDQKPCESFKSHYIVHAATSLLAFIDCLVVAVPIRKTHFVFPSFVLLVYSVFSGIYEVAGGPYRHGKEYIYSILNWRYKANRTVMIVIAGLILSPLMHLISCWGVYHIRLWLVSWFMKIRSKK